MKKLLIALLCYAPLVASMAQDEAQHKPIALKTYAEYGYNYVYGHHGNIAVSGLFPVTNYFDLQVGINAGTANVYALDGRATVHFPLKVGQLSLENRVNYQAVARNLTNDLCVALSLGYRMDYFAISIGGFCRLYGPMNNNHQNQNIEYIVEPFNMLWNIEGHVRRESDFWNLGARISNFDDFNIERFNEPIFTLIGRYNPKENIRLFAEVFCKTAGMFHIAVNFYEAGARVGMSYIFTK